MRKIALILVATLLFVSIPYMVMAQEGNFEIKINGKVLEISKSLGNPYIDKNGRTQIPARAIIEGLGFIVKWEGKTQTVRILDSKENEVASLQIGSKTVKTKDKTIQMDTEAIIKEGRTYVPLRFVSTALGFNIPKEDGYRFENNKHYIKIEKPIENNLKLYKEICFNDSEIAVWKWTNFNNIINTEDEIIIITTDKIPYDYYTPAHHYLKYYNNVTGEHIRTIDLGVVKRVNFKISNNQKYLVKYIDDGLGYLELYSLPDYKLIGKIIDSETKKVEEIFSFFEKLDTLQIRPYQDPLVCFSKDDKYLLFTSFNSKNTDNYRSSIVLWNLEEFKEEKIFYPDEFYDDKIKGLHNIWISPKNDKIFWYIYNKHIKNELIDENINDYFVEIPAIDIKTKKLSYVTGYKRGGGVSYSLAPVSDYNIKIMFDKTNNLMAVYALHNALGVKIFDIESGKEVYKFKRQSDKLNYFIKSLEFTNDNEIWVSFTDGSVFCQNILTGDYEKVLEDNYPINGHVRSKDSSIIITKAFFYLTHENNNLVRKYEPKYAKYDYKIWNGKTKKTIKILYNDRKVDEILGFSEDGNYLITLDFEENAYLEIPYGTRKINKIHIWDITGLKLQTGQ